MRSKDYRHVLSDRFGLGNLLHVERAHLAILLAHVEYQVRRVLLEPWDRPGGDPRAAEIRAIKWVIEQVAGPDVADEVIEFVRAEAAKPIAPREERAA